MNKKLIFTAFILILISSLSYVWYTRGFFPVQVYESPNKLYKLEIYAKKRLFTLPGDGGSSSSSALVILKNESGTEIGNNKGSQYYQLPISSIEVRWDLENDLVWYGKSKTINVKTGKADY
jgi:hypothetical protein